MGTNSALSTPNNKSDKNLKQRLKEVRQSAVKSQLENERLSHQIEEYQSFHNLKTRQLSKELNECKNKLSDLESTECQQTTLINQWKDRYIKAQSRNQRELKNHARSLQEIKKLKEEINKTQKDRKEEIIYNQNKNKNKN